MTESPRTLDGLTALVSGAAHGMGRSTAQLMASDGARLILLDRDAEELAAVADQLRGSGAQVVDVVTDMADPVAIESAVRRGTEVFGGLDVLVNNAGIKGFCDLEDPTYDEVWSEVLTVNLTSQQRLLRACLPWLKRSGSPRVVNIASTEALGATGDNSAYVAAKAGVAGWTRAMAVDLGKHQITVNCICPGPIDTPMTSFVSSEHKAIFAKRRTALGRYGTPDEVAHVTLSLCLPASSYITGAVIPVDGGLMARNA
ncbi:SDR family NAD(P)-dependent oxidoreductase [Nocardioides sp. AE5]|uniref:SDR family NAD(P)-dependent oxidoreductase n=1 Tax=Nocardioides sp. AE5 TaxID=2962573 RepID=UPI0028821FAF|nr:SDR family NAD(P)-dependent oxidoreductase [Nocardioides sp. AE5]MDT0202624.1 SDR family NAD(P)-dependent oxidoreductase [Nocardioides sp. AE5]